VRARGSHARQCGAVGPSQSAGACDL
jgi:hypothetical protein